MAAKKPEQPFVFSTRDQVFNKKIVKEWGVIIACAKARGDFESAESKARAEIMVKAQAVGGNGVVSYGIRYWSACCKNAYNNSTYRTAVWNTTGVCSFGTAVTLE